MDRMQGRHSSAGQIASRSLGAVTNPAVPRSVFAVASFCIIILDNYSERTSSFESALEQPQIIFWGRHKKGRLGDRRLAKGWIYWFLVMLLRFFVNVSLRFISFACPTRPRLRLQFRHRDNVDFRRAGADPLFSTPPGDAVTGRIKPASQSEENPCSAHPGIVLTKTFNR